MNSIDLMNNLYESQPDRPQFWMDAIANRRWPRYLMAIEREAIDDAVSALRYCWAHCTALDIGCGSGKWTRHLDGLGWTVTATETDRAALQICQRRVPRAMCLAVAPTDTDLPPCVSDCGLVTCIEVPPIIDAPWFPAELNRVLRPGGLFVGAHFNIASWRGIIGRIAYWLRGGKGYRFYSQSYGAWRQSMREAGFEVVSETGFCWFPFSRESDSPLVPTCAWLERVLGLRRLTRIAPWNCVTLRKSL